VSGGHDVTLLTSSSLCYLKVTALHGEEQKVCVEGISCVYVTKFTVSQHCCGFLGPKHTKCELT